MFSLLTKKIFGCKIRDVSAYNLRRGSDAACEIAVHKRQPGSAAAEINRAEINRAEINRTEIKRVEINRMVSRLCPRRVDGKE